MDQKTSISEEQPTHTRRLKLSLWLPFAIVAVLLGFLYFALYSGDPSQLPSALIGKPIPEFNLPPLSQAAAGGGAAAGLGSADFRRGEPALINVWSSWCTPCQIEHPLLMDLSRKGIALYGINYKDTPEAAQRFLSRLGNPYRAIGADFTGFTAIDFGVYGVPETFVIDGEGRILYRHPGPLSNEVVNAKILPALEKARKK